MKELKDLQVGDIVLVSSTWDRRLSKVEKITKTQIVVDKVRYRRSNGWQCGSYGWDQGTIHVPTEKEIAKIKNEEQRKFLIHSIRDIDFRKLATDKLQQVYNIIKSE